ncbi:hypothetical protein QJS04_geneDACA019426 [Acorus gramineus]|uniref:ribonuclease P n=1 Tax=Acorus gramineus TaxID=55184 RepID=A0AAV9AJV1_ACOGR|nr:hypothetical protein QJS04_geneDACA019426 [Acorus gramineus]
MASSSIIFPSLQQENLSFITHSEKLDQIEQTQLRKNESFRTHSGKGGKDSSNNVSVRSDGKTGTGFSRKTKVGSFLGETVLKKKKKKKLKKSEVVPGEIELKIKLDSCSKRGDVMGAIFLYDSAMRSGLKLEQYHYNVLLYLCSSAAVGVVHPAKSGTNFPVSNGLIDGKDSIQTDLNSDDGFGHEIQVSDDVRNYARERGFEIYEKMCSGEIAPSEAALTSVARLAVSMGDGDMAFEMVKKIKGLGLTPRLRSYDPALYLFCDKGNVEKAFEVERHMLDSGVCPEEPELEALLMVGVRAGRGDRVYEVMHKLRTSVRQVTPSVADLIVRWFESAAASRVGKRKWDERLVSREMENGGGGWHGVGWLGKGKWSVIQTHVNNDGFCEGCGEKLATIDIDPVETENFAESVASIARKRDQSTNFQKFQKWLEYYGPFEAVVDAANVGLFCQRNFSITKVNAIVNCIRQKLPSKKWPLIIVHHKRLSTGKMNETINKKQIEKWKNADAVYATPTGSNDDWFWLYAAIKCKCLIVTNDEMRDHLFHVLGNDFFPKWKERHQESAKGHWHVPIREEHDSETRTWLCVTRNALRSTHPTRSSMSGEIHPQKMTVSDTSDAKARSLPPKVHSSQRKISLTNKNLARRTLVSGVEVAEKLSGCVIDFQI